MDLYSKVERLIEEHIMNHKEEVRKGKELLNKLDIARCNDGYERKSIYWVDYDRNDLNRPNPFLETPDYTELPE